MRIGLPGLAQGLLEGREEGQQPGEGVRVSLALTVMEGMFEGFATGNDDIVDQLCAPDMIEHQFGMAGTGTEAIRLIGVLGG